MRLLPTVLTLLASLLANGTRADLLDDFSARAGHLGTFTQRVFDGNETLLAESTGDFAVLKPALFRWNITSPDSQLLVVDGESLWQYDRDLDTLIRRDAPDDRASPLQLLTTDRATLDSRYLIEPIPAGLKLTPREQSDYFRTVSFTQSEEGSLQLSILDTLGQRIELSLELTRRRLPEQQLFRFDPPEGVEWLEGAPLEQDSTP